MAHGWFYRPLASTLELLIIDMHNIGTESQTLEPGDKIAQLVMVPVVSFRALETQKDDLYNWEAITISGRGDGGFGSTGR